MKTEVASVRKTGKSRPEMRAVTDGTSSDDRQASVLGDLDERKRALDERERALDERLEAVKRREQQLLARIRVLAEREVVAALERLEAEECLFKERRRVAALASALAAPAARIDLAAQRRGEWNVEVLEEMARVRAPEFPDRADEWKAYLRALRPYADGGGVLPAYLDDVVRDVFGAQFEEAHVRRQMTGRQ